MGKAYQVLLQCPSPLRRSQLCVDFSPLYDREPHPDASLEASIDDIWDQRRSANPSLFNATKFRYGGYDLSPDCQQICLRLGLTDYKTFVGTNLSPKWEKFLSPSTDDVLRCKHTSSPLGNGAIVETLDSQIILLQRSSNVGEYPGHLVFPGGHSEPSEIGILGHSDHSKKLNNKIADEMFEGIVREVCEETGIPASSLSEAELIGISRRSVNVRPTAFFFMKCRLTSSVISEHYTRAADSFESTKLCFVNREELIDKSNEMPGCHEGGAVIFTKIDNMV
ncbi:hypothetical protein SELMODRAFT_163872 [Selaginella moellendorffii]|uniref:Nudix hydrolase domain-containing protein n=1 Tax=Selaginella moellendorffii TaxID=88036 RepID=D8QQL9_SELML|nr:nudix hydrolase 9 [Selaginella moellendorffii]EFJ37819.1 hypothetical protein SELMODRAFT_163872 [Selaginella moellendorffii]|eukprot:XP_002960280.1 nudix hydrolase 9 [Selaginella moellendorffii]